MGLHTRSLESLNRLSSHPRAMGTVVHSPDDGASSNRSPFSLSSLVSTILPFSMRPPEQSTAAAAENPPQKRPLATATHHRGLLDVSLINSPASSSAAAAEPILRPNVPSASSPSRKLPPSAQPPTPVPSPRSHSNNSGSPYSRPVHNSTLTGIREESTGSSPPKRGGDRPAATPTTT